MHVTQNCMYINKSAHNYCQITKFSGSEQDYLRDHVIDGRALFPATGYLMLAWKALAKNKHKQTEHLPVHVEDMRIHSATILPEKGGI